MVNPMSEDELLNQIGELIDKKITPVKELVEVIEDKVSSARLSWDVTVSQVRAIREQQSVMNKKLDEHSDVLSNRIYPSVVTIENEIKTYSDMYKINNDNAKKLEKRVETLEEEAGITPPPEFTLVEVS